jgi:hypothetical protein
MEQLFRNRPVKAKSVNVSLESNRPERYRMHTLVCRDQLGLCRPSFEFPYKLRPLVLRDRLLSEKVRKYCLIDQLGSEERRQNQVVFVVLKLRQFRREKCTDRVLGDFIVPHDIVGNLNGDFAWAFQLSCESVY